MIMLHADSYKAMKRGELIRKACRLRTLYWQAAEICVRFRNLSNLSWNILPPRRRVCSC